MESTRRGKESPGFSPVFYRQFTNQDEQQCEGLQAAFGHGTSPSTGFSSREDIALAMRAVEDLLYPAADLPNSAGMPAAAILQRLHRANSTRYADLVGADDSAVTSMSELRNSFFRTWKKAKLVPAFDVIWPVFVDGAIAIEK